eukprot:6197656-Pleurochrysis_carterae.AAC.1
MGQLEAGLWRGGAPRSHAAAALLPALLADVVAARLEHLQLARPDHRARHLSDVADKRALSEPSSPGRLLMHPA